MLRAHLSLSLFPSNLSANNNGFIHPPLKIKRRRLHQSSVVRARGRKPTREEERMKVKQISAGSLTNFEVLDFLRSRGVSRGTTRLVAPEDKPELQVYDYLVSSAACNQTRETINEFLKKCDKYDLAKAEKLNIINIRPSSVVEFQPIIEECEKRMTDEVVAELAELVVNVLPPPPTQAETENENMEENPDG